MARSIEMTSGPIFKRFVAYAIPLMLTGFLQIFFNMADQAVVGLFAGRDALSSVGATTSLIHLFVNTFIGLSVGAQVCIAHALGAKDNEKASRHAHNAIATSVAVGFVIALVGVLAARPILTLMKTPTENGILDGAVLYMQIYLAGSPVYLLYNYGAAVIKTQGDTKSPFVYLLCGGILNVILNVTFVVGFKMKAEGVALATVISNGLSSFLIVRHLMKNEGPCRIHLKKLKIYFEEFTQIMKKGIPIGLQSATFSFSNIIIQSSINSLGSAAMAGNTAAVSIGGFADVFNDSIAQTSLAFVGQNVGAKDYKRIRRITFISLVFGIISSALVGIFIYSLAKPLLDLFIPGDLESFYFAKLRFKFIILTLPIANVMQVLSNIMRAIGKALEPMLICVFGVCVFRLLWMYFVFPNYQSATCIYMSYPISWVLTDICLVFLSVPSLKHIKKKFENCVGA